MVVSFHTILIPVDFSVNTEVAVAKTLEISDGLAPRVFLLHVLRAAALPTKKDWDAAEAGLEKWKEHIRKAHPGITAAGTVRKAESVQECVRCVATELGAGLIVIGKSSGPAGILSFPTVEPMRLAEVSGIPVWTLKPGCLQQPMRTIVVPIADHLHGNKLAALELLCRRGKPVVHLVAFGSEDNRPSDTSALLRVYQWLKTRLHTPVEFALLPGISRGKALLDYARQVHADMLLAYPQAETRIGWKNQIPDALPAASPMQILAVQPAPLIQEL